MGIEFKLLTALLISSTLSTCGRSEEDSSAWDYFVFAQEWAPTMCLPDLRVSGQANHACKIPEEVTTWTVHGLWPSKKGSRLGPHDCDPSSKFDPNQVKSLLGELKTFWPNLFINENLTSFWSHEWTKHGTCAEDLAATRGEYNYFHTALKLNQLFNLSEVFKQANILPSSSTLYKATDMYDALRGKFKGRPYLECVSQGSHLLIGQIEVCTDKTFQVIDCPHTNHEYGSSTLHFEENLTERMESHQQYLQGHSAEPRPCYLNETIMYPVFWY